jgi:hypothetical protein
MEHKFDKNFKTKYYDVHFGVTHIFAFMAQYIMSIIMCRICHVYILWMICWKSNLKPIMNQHKNKKKFQSKEMNVVWRYDIDLINWKS